MKQNTIKCSNCGATLEFQPGTTKLVCPYCGAETPIETNAEDTNYLQKIPYEEFISNASNEEITDTQMVVSCPTCGAELTFPSNVVSAECAFCGTPLILKEAIEKKLIKPRAIIPFKINKKEAIEKFRTWLSKKWFAPSKAKKYSRLNEKMRGVYVPYWVFDVYTITKYTGERGDRYQVTVTRTDSEGKTYTTTETRIRWTPVSGTIKKQYKDFTINASKSLDSKVYKHIKGGWDFAEAQPYSEQFMAGFESHTYQITVQEGYQTAQSLIKFDLQQEVRRDIGGDEQRIHSMHIDYINPAFLLAFLPIWISSYRYKNKTYRFVVNGQNGTVGGEYPKSWFKIMLVVLLILIVIATLLYFFTQQN